MKTIDKEMFDAFPLKFELREGFPSAPLCPYGNPYQKIGFDIEAQEYVRFTKGVLKAEGLKKNKFNHNLSTVGFGGGCHWCTEAVFKSIKGVSDVYQGWISSIDENEEWSEAVLLNFDESIIPMEVLIEIHLYTHSSTSNHSMRTKYRSAVYYTEKIQKEKSARILEKLQKGFEKKLVTKNLPFREFKLNKESQLDYFAKNENNEFCERYIYPKLEFLKLNYSNLI